MRHKNTQKTNLRDRQTHKETGKQRDRHTGTMRERKKKNADKRMYSDVETGRHILGHT